MQKRLLVVLLVCLSVLASASDEQPNVIVVMTDDQGYGDLSCHGNPTLKTPNLDRLHAESIRFTDFHVSPFCTPTRAALMTGRYPARTGAYRTSSGRTSLHSREKTMGDLFTQNGYATGMFGKWHLGDCAPSRPMDCGFESSVWHRCGGLTQISDYWTNDYFDDTYLVGDRWKEFKGYCTDVWFDEAMKFMTSVKRDAGGEKPFFVYLATNAPHGPYLVADKWKQPFLDQGIPKTQAAFKGMVANFDWNLGRLLEYLSKEKLADNTALVFLTDNGTSAGTVYGLGSRITGWPIDPRENANMRGGKSSAYDGGHRVPLFVRYPEGNLGAPRDIDTLAAHFDLTPTLMELCGLRRPADWPELDGRSLMPLIRNDESNWQPRTLHSQMHGGNGYLKPGDPWEIGVAMTERWRLVEGRELYDIMEDPSQRKDVAQQHPDVVEKLNRDHLAWHQSLLPSMVPTRIHIGSDVENPTDLTSQEWVVARRNPPWAHSHVTRRMLSNGSWWLDVQKDGFYTISLSRWPAYLDKSLESTAARIEIGGESYKPAIAITDQSKTAEFIVELSKGPTELTTYLTTPSGKEHGAYFASVVYRGTSRPIPGDSTERLAILWTQYTLNQGTVKLTVHTSEDPTEPIGGDVDLYLERDGKWQKAATSAVDPLTAMASFRIDDWDSSDSVSFRVSNGADDFEGMIRAEPSDRPVLKLMSVACVNDKWFPYTEAVEQMLGQNPDVVFFAGDQIYESNAGGDVIIAESESDVPAAMKNYLDKWRKFGLTFRELLRDRPSIMITDDHDVYANDLWGNGGRRMQGDRTTGGYWTHPKWVNAAERTQTAHLPDPAMPGPWGDGIYAYYTSMDYAGVSFAILEDRKFKSPPSEVLDKAVEEPGTDKPNLTLEVIKDPAFDATLLDRPDLQLLGAEQEEFVRQWAQRVHDRRQLAAVLTQSPYVNIGNYDVRFGDMDSNGWPQSARNRALRCIAPSQAVMLSGDIHFGTLAQMGIDQWGDGPWSFSMSAFSSKQNRSWGPSVAAQGREIPGIAGSGNHHDRFGNKLTVTATAPGANGYGIVVFDKARSEITLELHTMDAERKPDNLKVPGWPFTIRVKH